MPSGFPNTAIFDSLVNIGQLHAISKVSGVTLRNITIQGDDVAVNIATRQEALTVISVSNDLGGKMNASKIIYRVDGSIDFLRTMYDTQTKVANKYMARAIASNIYFKPWSSP